jgi:hypothetical protein
VITPYGPLFLSIGVRSTWGKTRSRWVFSPNLKPWAKSAEAPLESSLGIANALLDDPAVPGSLSRGDPKPPQHTRAVPGTYLSTSVGSGKKVCAWAFLPWRTAATGNSRSAVARTSWRKSGKWCDWILIIRLKTPAFPAIGGGRIRISWLGSPQIRVPGPYQRRSSGRGGIGCPGWSG